MGDILPAVLGFKVFCLDYFYSKVLSPDFQIGPIN